MFNNFFKKYEFDEKEAKTWLLIQAATGWKIFRD
jgi:hypothetical protein